MEELRRLQTRYNAFVRAHATQVTAVENALRSASFFIPGPSALSCPCPCPCP